MRISQCSDSTWRTALCGLVISFFCVQHTCSADEASAQSSQAPSSQQPPTAPSQPPAQPDFEDVPSRWFRDPWSLLPPPAYEINEPGSTFNPYRQNPLKGDFPIYGEDLFFALTLTEIYSAEGRRLPTPRGNTGPNPGNQPFFGDPDQFEQNNNIAVTFDLFKGQQGFKPVDWRIKGTYVFNVNNVQIEEVGGVNANPARGRSRTTNDVSVQELFIEKHLFDLTDRYDFVAMEAGLLPFRSDFRGFIFEDTNLGARVLGNYDNNIWQYNVVAFAMREKDTNSNLNTWNDRDQQVVVANLYRQDWPVLGYTTSVSYHFNRDEGSSEYDKNEFLVRPAPIGIASPHEVRAHYAGWTGEGRIDRVNVTHAFYYATGRDDDNPIAAQSVKIDSFFGAGELSYDVDWIRFRGYGMYATGDRQARDDEAQGFDAILDAPNFAGGEFSFWNRQSIKLVGTNLTNRLSPLPDLQTSRFQGQSNFVNPGIFLVGAASDVELTPKMRFQAGFNTMRFDDTSTLESYLFIERIDKQIGHEFFSGFSYRPLLNNHVILKFGYAYFWSGAGFRRIYDSDRDLYQLFGEVVLAW